MTCDATSLAAGNLSVAPVAAVVPRLVTERIAPEIGTEDIIYLELTVTVEVIPDMGSGTSKMDRHVAAVSRKAPH